VRRNHLSVLSYQKSPDPACAKFLKMRGLFRVLLVIVHNQWYMLTGIPQPDCQDYDSIYAGYPVFSAKCNYNYVNNKYGDQCQNTAFNLVGRWSLLNQNNTVPYAIEWRPIITLSKLKFHSTTYSTDLLQFWHGWAESRDLPHRWWWHPALQWRIPELGSRWGSHRRLTCQVYWVAYSL